VAILYEEVFNNGGVRRKKRRKNANARWTRADDKFLKDHAGKWGVKAIADHFKKTIAAVRTRSHIRVVRAAA
jgi:hypothetical protein